MQYVQRECTFKNQMYSVMQPQLLFNLSGSSVDSSILET